MSKLNAAALALMLALTLVMAMAAVAAPQLQTAFVQTQIIPDAQLQQTRGLL